MGPVGPLVTWALGRAIGVITVAVQIVLVCDGVPSVTVVMPFVALISVVIVVSEFDAGERRCYSVIEPHWGVYRSVLTWNHPLIKRIPRLAFSEAARAARIWRNKGSTKTPTNLDIKDIKKARRQVSSTDNAITQTWVYSKKETSSHVTYLAPNAAHSRLIIAGTEPPVFYDTSSHRDLVPILDGHGGPYMNLQMADSLEQI